MMAAIELRYYLPLDAALDDRCVNLTESEVVVTGGAP